MFDVVCVRVVEFGYLLFVKLVNFGFSVGISKVGSLEEFDVVFIFVFGFDCWVILEVMIFYKLCEVEVGIFGNDVLVVSLVGELSFDVDFYDYEIKYIEGCVEMYIFVCIFFEVFECICIEVL